MSLFVFQLFPVDFGSDTAVFRFNTQQSLSPGDRIAGFAWLNSGFALDDAATFATFDSFFPVSGAVALNGGLLQLNRDLVFRNTGSFQTLGSIDGNGHELHLSENMSLIPLSNEVIANCLLLTLTAIDTPLAINSVDWSFDNRFVAVGIDLGGDSEVRVYGFDGSSLTFLDGDDLGLACLTVRWHPSELTLAAAIGPTDYGGEDIFVYDFDDGTDTLTLTDSDFLTGGGLSLDWHPTGNFIAVSSTNATKEVEVFSFTSGPGTIAKVFDYNLATSQAVQNNTLAWSPSGDYLAVGLDADGANDELIILEFNGSTLVDATSIAIGEDVSAVSWLQTSSFIAVGLSSGSERLRVYTFDEGLVSLSENTASRIGETNAVLSTHWNSSGSCLALGLEFDGSDSEFRVYDVDPITKALTLNTQAQISNSVNEARWSPNDIYVAFGGEQSELEVYITTTASPSFEFSDLKTYLHCNVTLRNCTIEFEGQNMINGQGFCLTLDDTCKFIVQSNSDLWFKNIKLEQVNGNKLDAVDTTSTYSFSRAIIALDGNTTFTAGKFDILDTTEIRGDGFGFGYQTDGVSTVSACGSLILDTGVTFSYEPSVDANNLFRLSQDAELILKSATVHASNAGLQLARGKLIVDGKSFLSNDGTIAADGFQFGDGLTAAHNLCVEILPAGSLELLSGVLTYDNV